MNKYSKDWRADIKKELADKKELYAGVCKTVEDAHKRWLETKDKTEFSFYSEMNDFKEEIESSISAYELLLSDKIYMTQYLWSDAKAFEVVEVINPDHMTVRRLKATLTNNAKEKLQDSFVPGGFFGHTDNSQQEWTFESNEDEPIIHVRRHKDGKFYEANTRVCPYVLRNEPYEWYDYNF